MTDNDGWTPLFYSVRYGSLECVQILLNSSTIDPNILSFEETPLHFAHRNNRKNVVLELLKDNRTNATIPDKNGIKVSDEITDPELVSDSLGYREYKIIGQHLNQSSVSLNELHFLKKSEQRERFIFVANAL